MGGVELLFLVRTLSMNRSSMISMVIWVSRGLEARVGLGCVLEDI